MAEGIIISRYAIYKETFEFVNGTETRRWKQVFLVSSLEFRIYIIRPSRAHYKCEDRRTGKFWILRPESFIEEHDQ